MNYYYNMTFYPLKIWIKHWLKTYDLILVPNTILTDPLVGYIQYAHFDLYYILSNLNFHSRLSVLSFQNSGPGTITK